jgi:hypothetical protein
MTLRIEALDTGMLSIVYTTIMLNTIMLSVVLLSVIMHCRGAHLFTQTWASTTDI